MMKQVRRWGRLPVFGAVVAFWASCGGSGGTPCKLSDGTYSVRLTKVSGTCPEQVPETTVTLPDRADAGATGCRVTENAAMCSGSLSCTERDATSTTTVAGTARLDNASAISGSLTITVVNNDASPGCTGNYTFTMTRR